MLKSKLLQRFSRRKTRKLLGYRNVVWGKNEEEHNITLVRVLQRAEDCWLTFGVKKLLVKPKEGELLRIFFAEGVSPDPKKVCTIKTVTEPKNVKKKSILHQHGEGDSYGLYT